MYNFAVVLCFCACATFISAGWVGPKSEEYKKNMEECKTETKASDADVLQIMKTHQADTEAGQCLMACIQKKSGMMSADNKMNIEIAKKLFEHMKENHEEDYNTMCKILEECKANEKPETNECVAMKNFVDCLTKKKEAAGIAMKN